MAEALTRFRAGLRAARADHPRERRAGIAIAVIRGPALPETRRGRLPYRAHRACAARDFVVLIRLNRVEQRPVLRVVPCEAAIAARLRGATALTRAGRAINAARDPLSRVPVDPGLDAAALRGRSRDDPAPR